MANEYKFSSDNVNVFLMVIDASNSMSNDVENIRKGLEGYKLEFENFEGSDSIAVGISTFSNSYYPGEFRKVKDINCSYDVGGYTALYHSIVKGGKQLLEYIKEFTIKNGIVPINSTFIFWSDGEPCRDPGDINYAKKMIKELNYAGINTVFIAFGDAISSEFGKKMGFQATINVENRNTVENFMKNELSQSCKKQSRSMKSLGSDFFSKATDKTSSSGYSRTTAQALEDDDWFDDI